MSRLNWDRTRKEKIIRERGSERVSKEYKRSPPDEDTLEVRTPERTYTTEELTCPKCHEVFATKHILNDHLSKLHDYRICTSCLYALSPSDFEAQRIGNVYHCPSCRHIFLHSFSRKIKKRSKLHKRKPKVKLSQLYDANSPPKIRKSSSNKQSKLSIEHSKKLSTKAQTS